MRVAAVTASALLAVAFAQAPAHASYNVTVSYTCTGVEVQNFTPSLTNTVQSHTIHIQGTYTCGIHVSAGNENYAVLSYDYTSTDITTSCTTVLAASLGTIQLKWHYGDVNVSAKGTYRFERTMTTVNGQFVYANTGTITNGQFQDATVAGTVAITTPQVTDCAGAGVNQLSSATAPFTALKVL
ncbi:hypothetical protein [Streptomyces sp. 4F14]|uniref:hypothetical protein n=1 Tax=Streptomyces sp. 4F14 TaxID=3394380 RepID=UPI003A89E307